MTENALRVGVQDMLGSRAAERATGLKHQHTIRAANMWSAAENEEARRHAMEVRKQVHQDMQPVLTGAWELAIKEIERRLHDPEQMSENGLKNLVISLAVTTDKWKGLTADETAGRFGGKKGSPPAEQADGRHPVDLASILEKHRGAG
ncbi:MAG: hypothetical protein NUW01_14280 [Gemmatimonadaceae bacterium]|nr:hypothetical protein [Gemmatimonadaceae bacterium]